MSAEREWQDLATDWQAQAVPAVDVEAIRSEVARRGRTLRCVVAGEWLLTVIGAAGCGLVALTTALVHERVLFAGISLFVLVYQVWMTRLRRDSWDPAGSDAAAMIELEMRRARTVLRYWWLGLWTCVALALLPAGVLVYGHLQHWPMQGLVPLWGMLLGMLVAGVPTGIYGVLSCRRARQRLARFERLRGELGAP